MKKLLLVLCGILVFQNNFAQSKKLPERKYKPQVQYLMLREYLDEYNFEYNFGYSYSKLTNSTYGEMSKLSNIKQQYGYFFNIRYNKFLPLILETGYSHNVFETKNTDYYNFKKDEKINFTGFEANANFILLPTAKFFLPYIGFGYGFYNSSVGSGVFNNKSNIYINETVNKPFFKAGVSINFHEIFYLSAEYKQSISIGKVFDFNQINAGIGFRLNEENTFINHRDFFEDNPIDYSFGYTYTKLNNQVYSENLLKSEINNLYGYYFNLRYTKLLPLIFDLGFSNSIFETTNDYYNFKAKEQISMSGFEGGLNLTLPCPNFLLPYIGIGYGYYASSTGSSVFDTEAKRVYKQNSDEAFWKAGLTINTGASFFFNTEYKQTFSKEKDFSFSQFNAGIGFRIEKGNFFEGDVKDDFDEDKIIFTYGYHETNFINSTFKSHIKNAEISKTWGHTVNLRITAAYPVMFDIGCFSSQFNVKNINGWQNDDSIKVRHRGGEIAILMPLLSKTKYFIPYLGGGYQLSQLYAGPPLIQESGKDYSSIIEMAKNTSSPIYKLGIMFNFNLMSFSVEYKHSIFNDKIPFYQLSTNVGFKF